MSVSSSAPSVSLTAPRGNARGYFENRRSRLRLSFLLLVLPAVIWFLGLLLVPLLNMFYLSVFRWDGLLQPKIFVGLANYTRLFNDPHFGRALRNAIIYAVVEIPLVLIPPMCWASSSASGRLATNC